MYVKDAKGSKEKINNIKDYLEVPNKIKLINASTEPAVYAQLTTILSLKDSFHLNKKAF